MHLVWQTKFLFLFHFSFPLVNANKDPKEKKDYAEKKVKVKQRLIWMMAGTMVVAFRFVSNKKKKKKHHAIKN